MAPFYHCRQPRNTKLPNLASTDANRLNFFLNYLNTVISRKANAFFFRNVIRNIQTTSSTYLLKILENYR